MFLTKYGDILSTIYTDIAKITFHAKKLVLRIFSAKAWRLGYMRKICRTVSPHMARLSAGRGVRSVSELHIYVRCRVRRICGTVHATRI